LATEFERAHELKKEKQAKTNPPRRHGGTEKR